MAESSVESLEARVRADAETFRRVREVLESVVADRTLLAQLWRLWTRRPRGQGCFAMR